MDVENLLHRDDVVDITDTVECYKHGKTWVCPCGNSTWGYHDTKMKKCRVCNDLMIDTEYESREAPQTEEGQATLGAFS